MEILSLKLAAALSFFIFFFVFWKICNWLGWKIQKWLFFRSIQQFLSDEGKKSKKEVKKEDQKCG